MCTAFIVFFFFFKQKTAYEMRISDWSSDVCSSDLHARLEALRVDRDVAHATDLDAGQRYRRAGLQAADVLEQAADVIDAIALTDGVEAGDAKRQHEYRGDAEADEKADENFQGPGLHDRSLARSG